MDWFGVEDLSAVVFQKQRRTVRLECGFEVVVHVARLGRAFNDMTRSLRANRQLQEIVWEDLKLTFDEFQEIAGEREARPWKPEELSQLHQSLDGWAAGLRLVLESGELQRVASGELRHAAKETLFEYFSGEVFDHLDEETRQFLLETSVLPSMTPRL